MRSLLLLAALVVALPAGAVSLTWVPIGDPGNAPDTATNCEPVGVGSPDCGSVAYAYDISKYEITNAQYAEFLNAVAGSDPLGLYHPSMGTDATAGGITRSGADGSYAYAAKVGFENEPVVYVTFYDALRFANWLSNGEGSGDTETGSYTITAEGISLNTIARNAGATIALPSENEWYKAAYYDPAVPGYYDYPAGTSAQTGCVLPGSDTGNSANCNGIANGLTDVGAYALSVSPYGTFDQGGNVWEWTDPIVSSGRGVRGGAWYSTADGLAASYVQTLNPAAEFNGVGFRVVKLAPEPARALLVLAGGLLLGVARGRRA